MMAKEGTFVGLSEKATNFTLQFLKNCFNRFNNIQPLFLTHNGDRVPMGYITSLGLDESDGTIHFKGIVFDEERKQRLINEGFDCISPEIELLSGTYENPVDGRIVGGAFTRNPAIDGTNVSKCVLAFSAVEDTTPVVEPEPENEETNMPEDETSTVVSNNSTTTSYNVAEVELAKRQINDQMETYKTTINALTTERDDYKSRVENLEQSASTYKEKYEALVGGEVSKLEAELKMLGIEKPGEFAPGLDVETRLEVLKSAKANLAKNSNLNTPPATNLESTTSRSTDRKEVARKMGLSEEYLKFLK